MEAHQLRLKKNDPRVVTYQIDRNINYTISAPSIVPSAPFYRPLGAKDGYILSFEDIYKKIDEMLELGGTGILLQGGLHPDCKSATTKIFCASMKRVTRKCICTVFPRQKFCASPKSANSVSAKTIQRLNGRRPAIHSRRRRGNSRR